MKDNKKVSIVVPIFNVETYLGRCLESLISQTYDNIEIIAVNDGSTDSCPGIIDFYARKDKRLVPMHRKNGGLSSARNAGLEKKSGQFVLFVDGDDYIERNTVDILVSLAKDEDAGIIMFPYIREYSTQSIPTALFEGGEKIYKGNSVKEELFSYLIGPGVRQTNFDPLGIDRINTAWGKLYRADLLEDIHFLDTEEIGIEDGWFNIDVLKKFKGTVIYTEKTWYHYEKRNTGSLLHSYKANFVEKRWRFYEKVQCLLEEYGYGEFEENLSNRIVLELFGIVLNLNNAQKSVKESSGYLKGTLGNYPYENHFQLISYDKLNVMWKIFYLLCRKKCCYILMLSVRALSKIKKCT